ncbi:MAG: permease-like cell division protein FtsX [Paramuribaculum sp.]|nr:permease-like cell division protein FtsX [Paramuribaculum sp.]
MKTRTNRRILVRGSQITAYISVSLLLLILGIVAFTGITARTVTDNLRSGVGFIIMVDETGYPRSAAELHAHLDTLPWIASAKYSDSSEVLAHWQEMMGEDCTAVLDVNPFLPEYEIKLLPQWSSADSVNAIMQRINDIECVYDVKAHAEIVGSVNHTVNAVIFILLLMAIVLTIIALVLINNMIRLEIFARRHIIHTMKFVGATDAFIRRPYLIHALIGGSSAGILASLILILLTLYARTLHESVTTALSWQWQTCVYLSMIITGALLCVIFAYIATNKYLHKSHEDIFN